MNIWMIGRSYPIKKNNMRGSFELEQAEILQEKGHKVSFLAVVLHPINKVKKWGKCDFIHDNISCYINSVPFFPERMHIHSEKLLKVLWEEMFNRVEKQQGFPDVIHVQYPGMLCNSEVLEQYKKRGAKIVVTEHWSKTLNNTLDNFELNHLKANINVADKIACVGAPLRKSLIDITKTEKEVSIVPNVVADIFKENSTKNKEFTFIVVGRLTEFRQIDKIIKCFSSCFKDKAVRLEIIGKGKIKNDLEKLVNELGIASQVEFTGVLERQDVAERISKAHCLICYSKFETFGVPVIEAWSCGIPAIASDALGFKEYWKYGLGYIGDKDSDADLKDAMIRVYEQYEKYNSAFIRNYAIENFGKEAFYKRVMSLYTE